MRKTVSLALIVIIISTIFFTLMIPSYATADERTCENDSSVSHSYSEKPKKDSEKHWYECSVCKDKKDIEEHKWKKKPLWSFIIIKETRKCEICSASHVHYGPMFYILSGLMYVIMVAAVISSIVSARKKAKK